MDKGDTSGGSVTAGREAGVIRPQRQHVPESGRIFVPVPCAVSLLQGQIIGIQKHAEWFNNKVPMAEVAGC